MDCARTAIRSKAKTVSIVYRRRKEGMAALPAEVDGAIAEGIELLTLKAPLRIEKDDAGNASALWLQQILMNFLGIAMRFPFTWKSQNPFWMTKSPAAASTLGKRNPERPK